MNKTGVMILSLMMGTLIGSFIQDYLYRRINRKQKANKTNGDRVRKMDNEELAGALECPKDIELNGDFKCEFDIHGDCRKCGLDWLNQEVEEE